MREYKLDLPQNLMVHVSSLGWGRSLSFQKASCENAPASRRIWRVAGLDWSGAPIPRSSSSETLDSEDSVHANEGAETRNGPEDGDCEGSCCVRDVVVVLSDPNPDFEGDCVLVCSFFHDPRSTLGPMILLKSVSGRS